MPTATKSSVLTSVVNAIKKPESVPQFPSVLEHLIYAVCREGTSRDLAEQAYQRLRSEFFDWNEIRVSSLREVEERLDGLPGSALKAGRILGLLNSIFEAQYTFDLEGLHKKSVKQVQKQLERYEGATPFVVSWTIQYGLKGHAVPVNPAMRRALIRLEVLDVTLDEESNARILEEGVPKAKVSSFCELISLVARTTCRETPNCEGCVLNPHCPSRGGRAEKPRRAAVRPK
jgi:endonuclease-3